MKYALTVTADAGEIIQAIKSLEGIGADVQAAPAPEPKKAEPEPETPKDSGIPTLEDVRQAMMRAFDAGKRAECRALLDQHGVKRVTDLAESEFASLLVEIEAL